MTIKQYILVCSDAKLSKGALCTQCVHAAILSINKYYNNPETQEYLKNYEHMTTVILKFSKNDTEEIREGIKMFDCVEWVEQPENEILSFGFRPYEESTEGLLPFLSRFKLL